MSSPFSYAVEAEKLECGTVASTARRTLRHRRRVARVPPPVGERRSPTLIARLTNRVERVFVFAPLDPDLIALAPADGVQPVGIGPTIDTLRTERLSLDRWTDARLVGRSVVRLRGDGDSDDGGTEETED